MEGRGLDVVESFCPMCDIKTENLIIRVSQKGRGEDYLVKCLECEIFHNIQIRPPKPRLLKFTLSDGEISNLVNIEVDDDEDIYVGDIFENDEKLWKVTRIDNKKSKPMKRLNANLISSIWATRIDLKIVKITMTKGEESNSTSIEVDPEKVYSCGSILELNGERWKIRALHTGRGRTLNGSRVARDIKRIYLHQK
ncbi:MAG: hypothetical protein CL993_02440 [Euryarchaeota archaeon]|nr:hypothetical protein [Euryarchaeota archaeon]